ncbi:MAG: competence protein ComJ [Patescibacteria group bacterium]
MEIFDLDISYSQIYLFSVGTNNPFNQWEDKHLLQGFSWREGSVGFATMEESGIGHISVEFINKPLTSWLDGVQTVIEIPYEITLGAIEIASIADSKKIKAEDGKYALFFQHGINSQDEMWCRFSLCKVSQNIKPYVHLLRGREFSATALLMTAEAAV